MNSIPLVSLVLIVSALVCSIISTGLTGGGSGLYWCRNGVVDNLCTNSKSGFKMIDYPIGKWGNSFDRSPASGKWKINKIAGQYFSFAAQVVSMALILFLLVFRLFSPRRHFIFELVCEVVAILLMLICGALEVWYGLPQGAFPYFKFNSWLAASFFCWLCAVLLIIECFYINRSKMNSIPLVSLILIVSALVCSIISTGLTGGGSGVYWCPNRVVDNQCTNSKNGSKMNDLPIGQWSGQWKINKIAGQYFSFAAQVVSMALILFLLVFRLFSPRRHFIFELVCEVVAILLMLICGALEVWYGLPQGAFPYFMFISWLAASFFCWLCAVLLIIESFFIKRSIEIIVR